MDSGEPKSVSIKFNPLGKAYWSIDYGLIANSEAMRSISSNRKYLVSEYIRLQNIGTKYWTMLQPPYY